MRIREFISEKWSDKYKRSIDCNNPKGFSQKAHCAGRRKKANERAPVFETFDKPYEYTWDEYQNAHALTDQNRKLKISFSGGRGTYFMDFQVDGRALVTNKGDAYRIFATVLAATKDFMSKYDVKILIFSAKNDEQAGPSRANLYDRMVQRYAQAAGYTVTTTQDQVDDDSYKKYRLTRKDLAEAFDKPYKGKWETSEHGDQDVLVKLPDGTYLSIMFTHEGDDEWQVEFYRNNSKELTGQGDQQRIFATVISAVQQFIKKQKPYRIIFSASKDVDPGQDSESRAKLYDRLIARYARAWGYEDYSEDHGDQVTYELTRIENENVSENFADGKQFRVTKQKNGFTVDLHVDGHHAGQYTHTRNGDDVRNFAEIFPEFRNKGHGGMLLLKAIDTADKLGMDFEEDSHSLTPAMSRLYDTLDSEGMIYGGNGAWAVSPAGEDALDEYLNENFADGKKKGKSRPGRVKRAGASCKGSVSSLRAKAKKYSGERGKMYHWCANMKSGRKKK